MSLSVPLDPRLALTPADLPCKVPEFPVMEIEVLRTPEERFAGLPGFPWTPRYLEDLDRYEGLRLHYLDEGPSDAEHTVLCLHGEPTWAYLYRKMIPVFLDAGCRVVAPDFFGFGRSDKPVDEAAYTFDFHLGTLLALVRRLDLQRITLVCQDWGGILGLTLPMQMPYRFARLLVMNTVLATGDTPLSEGFLAWRSWVARNPDLGVGRLMQRACPFLGEGETRAYDAPFPDARHKAGVRRFPQLVPDHPDAPGADLSRRARTWLRDIWSGPTFMAVGAQDPVLGPPVMQALRQSIRGSPAPFVLEDAGHFVQEWGETIAARALEYYQAAP